MATFSCIFVFFLVLLASFASSGSQSINQNLTQSINQFSLEFFAEVSQADKHAGKNIVLSGMSVHIALTMLSLGATQQTLYDMDNALHMNIKLKYDYEDAIGKMNSYMYCLMSVADRLYVKTGPQYTLNPLYEESVSEIFYSDVKQIDFEQADNAADEISKWVYFQTDNTIADIVKGSDLDNYTTLVLVSTLYVEGDWAFSFNDFLTTKQPFFISETDVTIVDMMFQYTNTGYQDNSDLDAKILKLDFYKHEVSMVFFLPNSIDGLPALEKKLATTDLKAVVDSIQPDDVTIFLPKIVLTTTAGDLTDHLTNLGMGIIFTDDATFEGIPADPLEVRLKVDKVIQKTYMNLEEYGLSSAAGDVVVDVNMEPFSLGNYFYADHPYFFIVINEDGQVGFLGHFTGVDDS